MNSCLIPTPLKPQYWRCHLVGACNGNTQIDSHRIRCALRPALSRIVLGGSQTKNINGDNTQASLIAKINKSNTMYPFLIGAFGLWGGTAKSCITFCTLEFNASTVWAVQKDLAYNMIDFYYKEDGDYVNVYVMAKDNNYMSAACAYFVESVANIQYPRTRVDLPTGAVAFTKLI